MQLFEDQRAAFEIIESHRNPIFVTGAAGTGKSQLLRHLRDFGKDARFTEVVAFTGAAAVNVDGRTIHNLVLNSKAWSQGIQVYVPLREDREIRKSSLEELSELKVLIIDEVSMVRADMIDALDRALRLAKQNSDPFGGVRVVMFGDVRQLPPFVDERNLLNREQRFLGGYEEPLSPYFFMAHVFGQIEILRIELTIQKRVKGNESQSFIDALNGLRKMPPDQESIEFINKHSAAFPNPNSTFLFSERAPAAEHNVAKLHSLSGDSRFYLGRFVKFDEEDIVEQISEGLISTDLPAPVRLDLKVGAKVMVVANLDVSEGLVNGAIGIVVEMLENDVVISLDRTDKTYRLKPHAFDWKGLALDADVVIGDEVQTQRRRLRKTKIIGSYVQIPLILAWGVTVHKVQGATLSEVAIDFEGQFHSPGQAYVAISRLTSVTGLSRTGPLKSRHFFPYSSYVEEFENKAKLSVDPIDNFETAAKKVVTWRDPKEIYSLLDNHLELIPQVRDFANFSHRKRMQYLRDEAFLPPSIYLQNLYLKNSEKALILYRNIDRAMRNKPLVLSAEVLGSSFEAKLRNQYEMTTSDFQTCYDKYGEGWREKAAELIGSGDDVETDVIPEYEVSAIVINIGSRKWEISLVVNPASRERIWQLLDWNSTELSARETYPTLGILLNDVSEEWSSKEGASLEIYGNIELGKLFDFLPYLFDSYTMPSFLTLNNSRISLPSQMEVTTNQLSQQDLAYPSQSSPYPEQRFQVGQVVEVLIGVYLGRTGVITSIIEIDFVQFLTVQVHEGTGPITIRGNYAIRHH